MATDREKVKKKKKKRKCFLASEYKKAGEASNRTDDIVDFDGDRFHFFFPTHIYIALRCSDNFFFFFLYSVWSTAHFSRWTAMTIIVT